MKNRVCIALLFLFLFNAVDGRERLQSFNRDAFYKTMETQDIDEMNTQLTIVREAPVVEKEAFEGALLMKKASLVNSKKEKLQLFKSGRLKLEGAASKAPNNLEYRFLRLIIQENAPKIVQYSYNIREDSDYIRKFYKNQSPAIQAAINNYVKKSKVLKPSDL